LQEVRCAARLGRLSLRDPTVERRVVSTVRIAAEQPAVDVSEGERKTVTALFANIKGSTPS
jgi:class 3 adenylate cyclase